MPQSSRLILTPTKRLARARARAFALQQAQSGHTAWLTPRIMTFSTWVASLWDAHRLSAPKPKIALNQQQANWLWQSLIDRQVFIGEPEVASLAARSWQRLHEHQLPRPERWERLLLSDDNRHFQSWAAAYRKRCDELNLMDEWMFAAELPRLISQGHSAVPEDIELNGFELPLTALQQDILDACTAQGTRVSRATIPSCAKPELQLQQYPNIDAEFRSAAKWAKEQLAIDPEQRIAVVVPTLRQHMATIERAFRECFSPQAARLLKPQVPAWHISLGLPLDQWPLVTDALAILALESHGAAQPQVQRLLRSPYLAPWGSDANSSSNTLAWLRQRAPFELTWHEIARALEHCGAAEYPLLLTAWRSARATHQAPAWPSEWTARWQQELQSLGFGRGRPLDSCEYQVLQRWHQLFESYEQLDLICGAPLHRGRALALLAEHARGTIFREQNTGVPVEILGVEEALGSTFDAVWLTSLDRDNWPRAPERDPLIPAALQTKIPRATSENALELAAAELNGLTRCAEQVRASYAAGTQEYAVEPTALLGDIPISISCDERLPMAAPMAAGFEDAQAPPYQQATVTGGTGMLRNQSDCPFRAFAQRRLGAVDLPPARPGLSAGQRGSIVHWALEAFWQDLPGSNELRALAPNTLRQRVSAAVERALAILTRSFRRTLSKAGQALEQQRTERLVQRWLALEQQRGEFRVEAREQDIHMTFAGLQLTGKIDRLDRLEDGSLLLLDYKTGRASKGDWFPDPRPVDPQLPAYAISLQPPPRAIAFAKLRPDELKLEGLSAAAVDSPGIAELSAASHRFAELDDWSELLSQWRAQLEAAGPTVQQRVGGR